MRTRHLIFLLLLAGVPIWDPAAAQTGQPDQWPFFCREVEIPSTLDGAMQKAYVYWAGSENPRPLVVSLHTWSGDYSQKDTLAWICRERNWQEELSTFTGITAIWWRLPFLKADTKCFQKLHSAI